MLILIIAGVLLACVVLQGLAFLIPIILLFGGASWFWGRVTEHPVEAAALGVLFLIALAHEAVKKSR